MQEPIGQDPCLIRQMAEMVRNWYQATERSDELRLRWATAWALAAHLVLFAITFPEFAEPPAEATERMAFVVKPVRFRATDPISRVDIPKARARRVPIPDPTPGDPEPLVQDTPVTSIFDSVTDLVGWDASIPPPPAEAGPTEFTLEMVRPKRISGTDPVYTEIARRARLEGIVIVSAVISREGDVRGVKVVKPLGLGLEEAAMEAVRTWRFEPATLRSTPVDVIYQVTVRFNLR